MTMDELENALRGAAVRIVTMKINDCYVKGQIAVLVAFTDGREWPIGKYKCTESGKENSVWQFSH